MNTSDWVTLGGTLGLGAFALLAAIIGPHLADRFKNWLRAPKIWVLYKNEPPHAHLTKIKFAKPEECFQEFPAYYFTVSLQNVGKSIAQSCEVILEEVWAADQTQRYSKVTRFWPTNLLIFGSTHADINPGRPPIHVAIGHISDRECQDRYERSYSVPTQNIEPLRFIFDFPPGQKEFFKIESLQPGEYLLKLTIVSENFKPLAKAIKLRWTGNWTKEETRMFNEEVLLTVADWAPPSPLQR